MTAWTVIGVLWAVAIGFFFLGWLAARMASQHTRAVESRPAPAGAACWNCGQTDAPFRCTAPGCTHHLCAARHDKVAYTGYCASCEASVQPGAPPSLDEGDMAAGLLCGNAGLDREEEGNV
jgi:hypothetical protein